MGSFFILIYLGWRDRQRYINSLDNPTPRELETMSPKQVEIKISYHLDCRIFYVYDKDVQSRDGMFDEFSHVNESVQTYI